ncbi:hydrogen peroxide-inducible genes activator [Cognatishimia sp. WU-CL00825]|uniref:hydrogen peroxide-inducible genes activator n=1 Tax=Cognatishimia sp. WU-CL00825 TaxID=3127658 RepID=UPI003108B7C9
MRPTLRQLEYIVAVADAGRIGSAAKLLHVSQPSLSAQISEVEADLGVTLFARSRSGAKVTPEAEEVVRRARMLLRDHEDLRSLTKSAGLFKGRLRLGVLPSVGPYLLPEVARRLHIQHPGIRLVVREETTRDLEEGLRSGRLDMIISTPEDHPNNSYRLLFTERFWAATALDHPLASTSEPAKFTDLEGQLLLTLGAQHRLSHIVMQIAHRSKAQVSDEYEGTSLDAIRLMAATGAGIALLPEIYARTEARRGTDVALRYLAEPEATRKIALMYPHAGAGRPGGTALEEILLDVSKRLTDHKTD